jgi:hypothetical protein
MFYATICLTAWGNSLFADVFNVNDTNSFYAALVNAADGDEILLQPGVYPGRFEAISLKGVTIRSADVTNRAIIDALGFGEGIKLASADRVTIADLIIQNASENGINIDDGGFLVPSTNITLRNLWIRDGGGHGIKTAGVDHFLIDRVRVTDWGSGFAAMNLLGAHDGLVQHSFIERVTTFDGFGIKVEAGSTDVAIRANRLVDAGERAIQFGGGVGSSVFRPQPAGDVAADDIIAEGNVIVDRGAAGAGIRAAVAFANVNGTTFRNNLVFRPGIFVGRILRENFEPGFVDTQNGTFEDNIIIWHEGDIFAPLAINVSIGTLPETFHFEGNTWFNASDPTNSFVTLPVNETNGQYGINPRVGPDSVVPWQFDWGMWLVNATELPQAFNLGASASLLRATPNEGASFDISLSDPLIGDWTLSRLDSPLVALEPFSDLVLVEATPGDYNVDSVVDAADYTIWRDTLGSMTDLRADGNKSGTIESADLDIWKANFGIRAGSSLSMQASNQSSVPEPGMIVLVALLVSTCAFAVRWRDGQRLRCQCC